MKKIFIKFGAYLFYALLFLGFFAFGYWLVNGSVKEIKEKIIWYRVHREVKKNLENQSSLPFDPSLDIRGQKRSTTPVYVVPTPLPTSMPNNAQESPTPQSSL